MPVSAAGFILSTGFRKRRRRDAVAPYRNILFATDFSDASKNALAHAAHLAARDQAELHVLHVKTLHTYGIEGITWPEGETYDNAIWKALDKELHHLALPKSVKVVKAAMRDVAAAPSILQYADDNGSDLIVVGSHGRKGLADLFFGSVAREVVRMAAVPVLVVGQGPLHAVEQGEPLRILAPVDFSKASREALAHAAALAAAHKAHLLTVHVIDIRSLPPYFMETLESVQREQVRRDLDKLIAESRLPIEVESVICDGFAEERIVTTARDHGVNLIVIATSGNRGVDRLLLGSVTERVLRTAPCPVLVCPKALAEAEKQARAA
jgi:nucleotide-binding universal stress UspA family protein